MLKRKRKYLKPQALFLRDRLIERPYNTYELRAKFNIYNPASRISELIDDGCVIEKGWAIIKDINGGLHRIRQYSLVSQFNKEADNDEG